jgi:nucleoside-diphosphate-sugar epimerase
MLAAAQAPQAAGRTYFISPSEPVSWNSLGDAAAKIMGRKPLVLRVPVTAAYAIGWLAELWAHLRRQPGFISREKISEARYVRWVCDASRADAELGVQSKTSLDQGLNQTLAWYKEAGWLNY